MNVRRSGAALVVVVAALLAGSAPASATDFCTDISDAACPLGANFAADLELAMETDGKDGVKDRIFIAAGTHLPSNGINFNPDDGSLTDDLEVIGAGRDTTILTTNTSSNVYVVNLNGIFLRKVTMRDLTVRVPASFPDAGGFGAALQSYADVFERVNFESRNPTTATHQGSSAVGNVISGGAFRNVRIFGSEGGGFGTVFSTGSWNPGDTLEIEDSDITGFQGGITYGPGGSGIPVHIRRSHLRSDYATVLGVYNADSSIENSVIEAGELTPFFVGTLSATSTPSTLTFRNNTLLNQGGASTAFNVSPSNLSSGNASAVISDSIIFGFEKSWTASAIANAPSSGDANVDVSYTNFENPGTATGDGVVNASVGNISQNPGFVDFTDYRLSPTSPSIDAGDPAAGGLLDDFEGSVRPLDGNGDGIAVRDQGAYEAPAIDRLAPKITKLKFKHGKAPKKGGTLKFRLSEVATVRATFKPKPARKNGKKRKTVKLTAKGKAGANKLVIKKRKLKPGKYRLSVVATDAAGNKSKPVLKQVKVKK